LGIHKYSFYRSPNIGIFVKCNDNSIMLPLGFASTKSDTLVKYLEISEPTYISIAGTRLLGPMMVMNNHGILVSSIASDEFGAFQSNDLLLRGWDSGRRGSPGKRDRFSGHGCPPILYCQTIERFVLQIAFSRPPPALAD
jgi:hypothetical protein